MENFRKVVNPCHCMVWNQRGMGQHLAQAFAEIEYKDGELTIHGVIGPRPSGNCDGSCGQCVDEIREGMPIGDWTKEMLTKFCDIWDEWHLNTAFPYISCEHQRELGWDKLAKKKVTLYKYTLTNDMFSKQLHLQNHVKQIISEAGTVTLTDEELELWNLPLSKTTWEPLDDPRYKPKKEIICGDGPTKEEQLRWLTQEQHPEGLKSKQCPICGHKFGDTYAKRIVPEEVLQFLYNLPDTTREPAWV